MNSKFLMLAGVVLFMSCVSSNVTRLGTSPERPPTYWKDVVIFRTADKVPGDYEELALIHSTGSAMWTNEKQMYISMKKKAAEVGANAIILDAMSEPSAGAKVASIFLGVGGADRKGKAVAINVFLLQDEIEKKRERLIQLIEKYGIHTKGDKWILEWEKKPNEEDMNFIRKHEEFLRLILEKR